VVVEEEEEAEEEGCLDLVTSQGKLLQKE